MEGVIDVYYTPAWLPKEVQHRVFYLDGHPSRYQPRPIGLNLGEQTEMVRAVQLKPNNRLTKRLEHYTNSSYFG